MSKGSIYKDAGYWWWRNPRNGVLMGPFMTREQARQCQRETNKLFKQDPDSDSKPAENKSAAA